MSSWCRGISYGTVKGRWRQRLKLFMGLIPSKSRWSIWPLLLQLLHARWAIFPVMKGATTEITFPGRFDCSSHWFVAWCKYMSIFRNRNTVDTVKPLGIVKASKFFWERSNSCAWLNAVFRSRCLFPKAVIRSAAIAALWRRNHKSLSLGVFQRTWSNAIFT